MTMAMIEKGTPAIVGKIEEAANSLEFNMKHNFITRKELVLGKEELLCDAVSLHNRPETIPEAIQVVFTLLSLRYGTPVTIFGRGDYYMAVTNNHIQWM